MSGDILVVVTVEVGDCYRHPSSGYRLEILPHIPQCTEQFPQQNPNVNSTKDEILWNKVLWKCLPIEVIKTYLLVPALIQLLWFLCLGSWAPAAFLLVCYMIFWVKEGNVFLSTSLFIISFHQNRVEDCSPIVKVLPQQQQWRSIRTTKDSLPLALRTQWSDYGHTSLHRHRRKQIFFTKESWLSMGMWMPMLPLWIKKLVSLCQNCKTDPITEGF